MVQYSDRELMQILKVNKATLARFWQIQKNALVEAKKLKDGFYDTKRKVRILGISGATRLKNDCPHEGSNSEWLLQKALDKCKQLGAEIKLTRLWDYNIQPCKGCYSTTNTQCHFKCTCYPEGTEFADDMTNILYDQVLWADGILFATPVHNFKVSSPLSLWLDRAISLDGSLEPANLHDMKNKELNIKHTKFIEMTSDNNIWGSGFLHRFTGKVAGIIATGHEAGLSLAISSLYMTLNQFGMVFPPYNHAYVTGDVCKDLYADRASHRNPCHINMVEDVAVNVVKMIHELKAAKGKNFKKDWWIFDASTD